ncbi:hypothetical protein ACS0TY_003984 [Phlomoides rotata]
MDLQCSSQWKTLKSLVPSVGLNQILNRMPMIFDGPLCSLENLKQEKNHVDTQVDYLQKVKQKLGISMKKILCSLEVDNTNIKDFLRNKLKSKFERLVLSNEIEQSEVDTITTMVRHLRENITELQKNYNQLTLNVKKKREQKIQTEPQQAFQIPEPGKRDSAYTSPSSNLEDKETEHQELKPDVSKRPSASGFKEEEINLRSQMGHKRVDTNIAVHGKTYSRDRDSCHNILSLIYLVNIHDFGRSKEQTPLMLINGTSLELSAQFILLLQESWHNNPHLKRGEKSEIKVFSVASEDTTNEIKDGQCKISIQNISKLSKHIILLNTKMGGTTRFANNALE